MAPMPQIEKPIFIVGSGRSGTTLLYNLLATHPEVCWFSNLTDKFPSFHCLAAMHRLLDAPLIGYHMKRQIIRRSMPSLRPSEAENIYHKYCRFQHARKTTSADITEEMELRFKCVTNEHLRFTGKKRFLNKQTANTQRIELIQSMFPKAYIIHIIRDGRAVANSLLHVPWWNNVDIWWLGYRPDRWEKAGREPVELCAQHWKRDVEEILQHKHLFKDRYFELKYEELVKRTRSTALDIFNFCHLKESKESEKLLPESLKNMNYKWESQLTEPQKRIVNSAIGNFMKRLGYSL